MRNSAGGDALLRREHQSRDQRRRILLHRRDGVRVAGESAAARAAGLISIASRACALLHK
jgi:hypothetical protein